MILVIVSKDRRRIGFTLMVVVSIIFHGHMEELIEKDQSGLRDALSFYKLLYIAGLLDIAMNECIPQKNLPDTLHHLQSSEDERIYCSMQIQQRSSKASFPEIEAFFM